MKAFKKGLWLPVVLVLGLLFTGCLLISATFVIVEDFSFTAAGGFYHESFDLTSNSDWQDHKDNIDMIDAVGFEMTFINSNPEAVTFNAYIAPAGASYTTKTQLDSLAYVVIHDLTVQPDTTVMTYGQSLTHIQNFGRLKDLVKSGAFEYYGTSSSSGSLVGQFKIDPGKVIITFSASQ
jgi:hypothetical protein